MDLSGVSASAVSMVANTVSQVGDDKNVAMEKKAADIQKDQQQTAVQQVAAAEQSASKPQSSGAVGGNIDVMV